MTKLNLLAVLIPILFQLNATAGTLCQTITPNTDKDKYSVEVLPEDKGNIVLFRFTVPEECYVNIKVTDQDGITIQELVQGEMTSGTYNVYHSSSKYAFNKKNKCIIEIFRNHDGKMEAVYSKEIMLYSK